MYSREEPLIFRLSTAARREYKISGEKDRNAEGDCEAPKAREEGVVQRPRVCPFIQERPRLLYSAPTPRSSMRQERQCDEEKEEERGRKLAEGNALPGRAFGSGCNVLHAEGLFPGWLTGRGIAKSKWRLRRFEKRETVREEEGTRRYGGLATWGP
ncbi:hypothetical protein KM043_006782 [Ampulex compressa]|nr:hypothetical protein KM043_006782 [Ampulex compressa]